MSAPATPAGRAFLFAAAGLLAACSALFEEPAQCKTDEDCGRFAGTVCNTSGMCEAPGLAREGSIAPAAPAGSGAAAPAEGTTPPGTPPPVVVETCPALATRPEVALAGGAAATATDITTDVTLDCNTTSLLRGTVTVQAGATLTIKAGTVIKAEQDAALVIAQGAKLVVTGNREQAVIFTSAAATPGPGQWKGVAVLGKAPPAGNVNGVDYGGDVEADSSGSLQYVRVEYAAQGLSLLGVGSGTLVDGVQVRKTTDNCFTINGGRVDLKHLVCQYPADEMFELNAGYQGRAQFLVGQRTPTQGGGHHGLLVDNAKLVASNVTLCGADQANQGRGLMLRNNAAPALSNVIVRGFAVGMDVMGAQGAPFELKSSVFNGNTADNVATDENSTDPQSPLFDDDQGFNERTFFSDAARKNVETDPGFACFSPTGPSFAPPTQLTGDAPPADAFFEATAAYAGAVRDGTGDWTKDAWLRWSAD